MDQWTSYQSSPTTYGSWNGMDLTLTPPLFQQIGQPPYGTFGQLYSSHVPQASHRFESSQPIRSFPLQPTRFPAPSAPAPVLQYDNCRFQGNVSQTQISDFGVQAETSTCSNPKPFILFAINFDNVSVRNLCQEDGDLIYLVAYNHEIDLLSAMALDDLLKLDDVKIKNPEEGVRVLTTVDNMKLTLNENPSNKVYSIEMSEENIVKDNDENVVEKEFEKPVASTKKVEDSLTNGTDENGHGDDETIEGSEDENIEVKSEIKTETDPDEEIDDFLESSGPQNSVESERNFGSKMATNMKKQVKREKKDAESVLKKLQGIKRKFEDDNKKGKMANQCPICRQNHLKGVCVIENPENYFPDNTTSTNSYILSYSSLPPQFRLGVSQHTKGFAVYAAEKISPGTAFGPVVGQEIDYESVQCLTDLKYIWFLEPQRQRPIRVDEEGDEDGEDEVQTFLTTEDEMNSNWCRFLTPTLRFVDSNFYYVQTENEIYFITRRTVKKGEEIQFYAGFMDDQQHLVLSTDELRCHRCSFDFDDIINYIKHVKIVHPRGITRKKEKCKICHKVFHKYAHLANHAQNEHGGMGAYKCEQCGRDYLYARQLNRHIQTVHKHDNPETSTCSICGTMFKNAWRLKHHIRRNHSEKRYNCEQCRKIFNSKMGLERHLKTHTQEFAIFCDRCGKGFRDGSNLKVHLLTHSGVKPFACLETDCTTAYTTKQCLQIHYRKVHGYAEDNMPEIIRTIPFTVEAHSDTVT